MSISSYLRSLMGNETPKISAARGGAISTPVKVNSTIVVRPEAAKKVARASGRDVYLNDDFDFGRFTTCLTATKSPLEVSDKDRSRVAIISDNKGASCTDIIIVNSEKINDPDLKSSMMDLRQRLVNYREKENLIVGHEPKWMRAHSGVQIEKIYNRYESTSDSQVVEVAGAEQQQAEKKIEAILVAGIEMKCSDIHIEIRNSSPSIRFRVNGDLVRYEHAHDFQKLVTLSKVCFQTMCEMKGASYMPGSTGHRAILDRPLTIDGAIRPARLRFQSISHGAHTDDMHDLVLRVLPVESMEKSIPLVDLGYEPDQARLIDDSVREANGVICFAGTTGSGKSTSIASCVVGYGEHHTLNGVCTKKIITVEDPIEFEFSIATQVAIPEASEDETLKEQRYSAPIADALRSDPDLMMISEVREKAAAGAMKKAVLSGHPCMTTVHAQSAIGAGERLEDIGIPLETLGSPDFINIFIFQGLAQLLCSGCKLTESELRIAGDEKRITAYDRIINECKESGIDLDRQSHRFRNYDGCKACSVHSPGVAGRTVVAEIFKPDLHAKTLIRKRELVELQKYWLDPDGLGGMSFRAHAFLKIERGLIDPIVVSDDWGKLNNV